MGAGNVGIGALTGAAGGAATGSIFGPVGAVIGGGIGAIGGLISGLSGESESAKQRQAIRNQRIEQAKKQAEEDYWQRFAAISGISGDPMYLAMSYKPFDEQQVNRDTDLYLEGAMPEQGPNYGALFSSLGSLGATIGQGVRADALEQQRKNAPIIAQQQAYGNPWANYAPADMQAYGNGDLYGPTRNPYSLNLRGLGYG